MGMMLKSVFAGTALLAVVGARGATSEADGVLTIDGEIVNVSAESDLGTAANVVMQNGGGVAINASLTAAKTYAIAGDGLNATGVVSVAAGKTFTVTGARLAVGAVGHVLVKRGPGTVSVGNVGKACASPTRFIVEEGKFQCSAGDFWGGHTTANDNCTIDVREGAVYDHGTGHGVVGPIELTGATFTSRNTTPASGQWADAALNGGVTAHPCATPSYMSFASWGFLGHNHHENCVMNVEQGAVLIIDGVLSNGFGNASANILTKRGGGELVLMRQGGWTGGTVLEGGTVTVCSPQAFWTGGVTVNGDVTIQVPAGVTFTCPAVSGSGTITKTGAGVANFPSVAAGVTVNVAEANSIGTPLRDGTIYLSGDEAVVNVPAGETVTVGSIVESASGMARYSDIVKTGDGTLVLPTGSESKYRKLIVKGGFVEIAGESCFGAGGVDVQNGGGLRFTASMNQARSRITCSGEAVLDVPTGVTLGVHSNYFVTTGATVTKTGGGLWQLRTTFRKDQLSWINFTGTKWIVHEGRFKFFGGDNFGGAGVNYPLVIEAHEGVVLEMNGAESHTPLHALVLRGATMLAPYAQFQSVTAKLEGGATWGGWGLEGPITVLPSLNREPSRIIARRCHLAHSSGRSVFDVQEGATLEIDALLQPGSGNSNGLVKKGKGKLKLLKSIGAKGPFDVLEGTVELGPKARLNTNLTLNVRPVAKFVLGDGAQLTASTDLAGALCGTADVWFDASRLTVADGATVSSVPNLGTAGGTFGIEKGCTGYTPTAPTFVADGIGGRGTLYFNGSQALMLHSHTNRGVRTQVFFVSKWTSWEFDGGKGKWGGPFSMSAVAPAKFSDSGDDNNCSGALCYQHWTSTMGTLQTLSGDCNVNDLASGISVGVPYLTHSGRDAQARRMFSEIWREAGYAAKTNSAGPTVNCDIDAVCVGARTRKGLHQVFGAGDTRNRSYIGQIGEVLVFSRELSAAETATIYAYLKKKWFGVGEIVKTDAAALASTLNVEVPAGAEAGVALNVSGTTPGVATAVAKTGAGTLRLGGAFAGEALVDVQEGGLALRRGGLPPQVDIWVDATDASTMTLDAANRVTNLVNKGSAGGSFTLNARGTSTVPGGPLVAADGINGQPALQFDGAQALALAAYTNRTSPRRLSVYAAAVRTSWQLNPAVDNGGGLGKWGSIVSLARTTATASDENLAGAVHFSEGTETTATADQGSTGSGNISTPATGTPYLFTFHSVSNGCLLAYETAAMAVSSIPRTVSLGQDNEPLNIDLVQLACRIEKNGRPEWYGDGHTANRTWYGKIGEFIVTTEPLSDAQEGELFTYLRKKWLDKGTGTATPPAWLGGVPAAPAFGAQTALSMADGTHLVHEADTVALGALETAGTTDWTRVWNGLDANAFTLFSVAGDVALGNVHLDLWPVPQQAQVLGFAGTALTTPTWTVTGGTGAGNAAVSARADGYWLGRCSTTIFIR